MIRRYVAILALSVIASAFIAYGHYQKKNGRKEVQQRFDSYVAKQTEDTLQASLANQEISFMKQKSTDRSRQNDFENAKKLVIADDSLRVAVAGLRDTITSINHSAKTSDSAEPSAGIDGSTKITSELLGECASRYQDVAREAGELSAKVIGLQGFVTAIDPGGR